MAFPLSLFLMALTQPVAPPPSTSSGGLPSVECVRTLRSATVAQLEGSPARELERLELALAACADPLPALVRVLAYHRRHPLPEEEHERLHTRLVSLVADPAYELPPGMPEHLVREPEVDDEVLALLREQLVRRARASSEPATLRALAELELRLGRAEDAVATLESLYSVAPSGEVLWALLVNYRQLERWSEMARLLEGAIAGGSTHLRTQYIEALSRAGRVDETFAQVEQLAREIDPAYAQARELVAGLSVLAAWNLRDSGRLAEAERFFRLALQFVPAYPAPQLALLYLYGTEAEQQQHAEALRESWSQETNPHLLLEQGADRLASGDAEMAFDLLQRAAPEFPALEAPWFNLGIAASQTKRWAEAAEALSRAIDLNATRAESFFFRGLAFAELERCGEAVSDLERALEIDPSRTAAHYHLASCYGKLGHADDADRHRRLYQQSRRP